ncbi:ASCH domain-containing protein [Halorubrum sp. Atlit-26R]|uniref:ASCH domain-containing protein n=1 Tax=Halorubrum sp. Atlit-26R TaxID=2282128 RepID=UPI000EF20219|nr:ASCH domain-containing protein [Halorubrum sp. Atlit-26R]RLM68553.1 ASCH domain-containing protein [Halorubrum sp. Atlit-26R]
MSGRRRAPSQSQPEQRQQIKFANELVASVIDGDKQATVRYDGFEDVEVGDTLTAATEDGSAFADLKIRRTAVVDAVEAYQVLAMADAGYDAESPQGVINNLNKHYEARIRPSTTVTVLVFEVR